MALLCTMVLVAHPLQVEPVAFATQRNALLALLFSLAALLAYTDALGSDGSGAVRRRLYVLSLVFTVAALFSKATALSLVLVIGLVDLYLRRGDTLRSTLLRITPHAVATLLAAGLHVAVAQRRGVLQGAASPVDFLKRLLQAVFIPEFYVWKALWPVGLCIEYDFDPVRAHSWLLVGMSALVGAVLVVVVLRGWRARTFAWFAALACGAALVPVLNLMPTHPLVADRYVQIPLVFFVPLLLAPLLSRLPTRAAVGLTVVLVVTLGALSFRQVPTWKSSESLFSHAIEVNPRATQSLGNLGMLLWDARRRDEANAVFERLAEVDPEDFQHDLVRGWQALDRGDLNLAERWLESAAGKSGTMKHLVYLKLGELHEKRRDLTAAVAAYERALAMARVTPAAGAHVEYLEAALRRLATRRRGSVRQR
ncbi:MAG: tetratricopeptide repeat protein [bacterium]|nr:tetratricopeptide repeat protein [bacterium]